MKPPHTGGSPEPTSPEFVMPLEPGDRLTREEFERRYEAMPRVKKAELIEGVVYMPSPVRLNRHGNPHAHLIGWLVAYAAGTPGVRVGDNCTLRIDESNEPQPDAVLLIDPERGGQARVSDDDYLEGAPELLAEVAASSAAYDVHTKLEVYRRTGIREYLVWRVLDREIDWFVLHRKRYVRLTTSEDGLLRSETYPGLWLDPAALLAGDLAALMAAVQRGLAGPEHAAFVTRLGDAGD
jgi:hypothetical protein